MPPHKTALNVVHFPLPAHEVSNAFSTADLAETTIAEVDFTAARFDIFPSEVIVIVEAAKRTGIKEVRESGSFPVDLTTARHVGEIVARFPSSREPIED